MLFFSLTLLCVVRWPLVGTHMLVEIFDDSFIYSIILRSEPINLSRKFSIILRVAAAAAVAAAANSVYLSSDGVNVSRMLRCEMFKIADFLALYSIFTAYTMNYTNFIVSVQLD